MIYSPEQMLYAEILFENQQIEERSSEEYKRTIQIILGLLLAGHTFDYVKKTINDLSIETHLRDDLADIIKKQSKIIGKKPPSMSKMLFLGYNFNELVKFRKQTSFKNLIAFLSRAHELRKSNQLTPSLIANEVERYKKSLSTFHRTQAKQAREYSYAKAEIVHNRKISGWVSVAVLDNRTSSTCLSLHNKFYSAKVYATRMDIPNPPPRHPNCRSILVTVWADTDPNDYHLQNVDEFLRSNPERTKEIMGIKKSKIYLTGKTSIRKFVDITNGRYFRNDELIEKLKIKGRRLDKINIKGGNTR